MIEVSKTGETLVFKTEKAEYYFPSISVFTHADKNSDSVDIKLRASRKTVLSFNYKDMTPTQTDAETAANYIAALV